MIIIFTRYYLVLQIHRKREIFIQINNKHYNYNNITINNIIIRRRRKNEDEEEEEEEEKKDRRKRKEKQQGYK